MIVLCIIIVLYGLIFVVVVGFLVGVYEDVYIIFWFIEDEWFLWDIKELYWFLGFKVGLLRMFIDYGKIGWDICDRVYYWW